MGRNWPKDKDLIAGRKVIMDFLNIANWDSVQRLVKNEALPVGKIGGRWCGRRENLLRWLDQRTHSGSLEESTQMRTVDLLERVEAKLAGLTQARKSKEVMGRKAARRRAARLRRVCRQFI